MRTWGQMEQRMLELLVVVLVVEEEQLQMVEPGHDLQRKPSWMLYCCCYYGDDAVWRPMEVPSLKTMMTMMELKVQEEPELMGHASLNQGNCCYCYYYCYCYCCCCY